MPREGNAPLERAIRQNLEDLEEQVQESAEMAKVKIRETVEIAKRNNWKRPLGQPPRNGPPKKPTHSA